MPKLLLPLLLVLAFHAGAQTGYEDFYSEKVLRSNVQQAKTPIDKVQALGFLATKNLKNDSVAKEMYAIAEKSGDKKVIASAMWWDATLHEDSAKAIKLLIFANRQKLPLYQIAANLSMSDYHIHHDYGLSLSYAMIADSLLKKWDNGTQEKDSLTITVYRRLAHIYIHREDIVNASRYLLDLRNYAEQDKNEALKIEALEVLADMYYEADKKRAVRWIHQLRDYFEKTSQRNKFLGQSYNLGLLYYFLNEDEPQPSYKDSAVHYFKVMDKLADSLQAWGYYYRWSIQAEFDLGMMSAEHAIELLNTRVNEHAHFSLTDVATLKTQIYLSTHQLDSAKVYISSLQKLNFGTYVYFLRQYHFENKEYDKEIALLKQWEKRINGYWGSGKNVYKWLVEAYLAKKDYKLAYDYLILYNRAADSIDKGHHQEEVASMELQKAIELQKAGFNEEKKAQEAEQARIAVKNKIRFFGLLTGVAILLSLAGILWRNNVRKQRDKLKIEQAYTVLKSTQAQLIQSEKMASLGELTAGIAHEIQNPLNFVNNFSEVNSELVDELNSDLAKGNVQSATEIAHMIKDNEKKIGHHGRRADAIVKGMLQHSRTNSGQKEPTDINALADEYLRLAYHGLRAKDNSFNARIQTDLDQSIGKINVVSQDIGRVLLNLINNAFYAVAEKKQHLDGSYEPMVSLITRKAQNGIEVMVKDNGNGIPEKISHKIFQPFFTTKPTGQGTGLGLSLSYDIITKAHGGELNVKTKEGEGSEFIIQLPA